MNEDLILHMIGTFPQIPGKKVFQKLSYFLQEAEGARLGVRFRMKRYGPYSAELEDRLQDLAERHLVSISGSSDEGFTISFSDDAPTDLPDLDSEDRQALERLTRIFRNELSRGLTLELLASLHFLAKGHPYSGTEEEIERLVKQVQAWKGKKFDSSFIQDQVARLEEIGYLKSQAP